MNQYLVFQLQGPMASWGEPAPGEVRHTHELPARSALLGLLGAALGITRDDEVALNTLNAHYQFIICAGTMAQWSRDYHTVQVPKEIRKVHYYTRRDELRDKLILETTISKRDYYADGYWLVAIAVTPGAPYSLEELQVALQSPVFPLSLGRKSHPPGLPLFPQLISGAANKVLLEAQALYRQKLVALGGQLHRLARFQLRCWWEGEHEGLQEDEVHTRRDQPLSRKRWQFRPRIVKQGMLKEETPCISQE